MSGNEFFGLPVALIDKINTALNIALSLALVHAPEVHGQIMEAALGLDEAMNASDEDADDEESDE